MSSVPETAMNRAGPNQYRYYLFLLLLLYTAAYGWILVSTDFMPYVMDNNESFSVLWHSSNLYHFSFWQSFGLTDEAFSPDPAAHPVPHTHQGNMPRLFGFLIFLLGARSIESQIFITAAVIGTLTVLMMYHYFTKLAGPLFAFICSSLLITDYLLFMQWHVGTYRVWYAFLFFLGLLGIHGISGPRSRLWKWLMVATYMLLFYFELVFAGLIALFSALYAVVIYRRTPSLVKRIFAVQFKGAVTAVLILFAQLSAVFGPSVAFQDFRLTFFSRNNSAGGLTSGQLEAFFESHNIAYWYNVFDTGSYRNHLALLRSQTYVNFQVYTPILTLIAVILGSGWLLGERQSVPWAMLFARVRKAICLHSLQACWVLGFFALAPCGLALWLQSGRQLTPHAALGFMSVAFLLSATVRWGPSAIRRLVRRRTDDPVRARAAIRLAALLYAGFLLCFLPCALSQKPGLTGVGVWNAVLQAVYAAVFLGMAALAVRPGWVLRLSLAAESVELASATLDQQAAFRRIAAGSLLTGPVLLLLFRIVLGPGFLISPWMALYILFVVSFVLSFFYWGSFRRASIRLRAWVFQPAAQETGGSFPCGRDPLPLRAQSADCLCAVRVAAGIAAAFLIPFAFVLLHATVDNALVFQSYTLPYFLFLCLYLALCISMVRSALKPALPLSWLRMITAALRPATADPADRHSGMIAGSELAGSAEARAHEPRTLATAGERWEHRFRTVLKAGILFSMLFYLISVVMVGGNVLGTTPLPDSSIWTFPLHALLVLLAAAAGTLILTRLGGGQGWTDFDRLSPGDVAALAAFLFLIGNFIQHHWEHYEQDFSIIWMGVFASWAVILVAKLSVLLAVASGMLMILLGSRRVLGEHGVDSVRKVFSFFLLGEVAYSVIYFLSPGYVLTGYQWRHAPFAVFFTCVIPALAVYLPVLMAAQAWNWFQRQTGAIGLPVLSGTFGRRIAVVMGGGAALLAVFVCAYWAGLQVMYSRLLPPDHYRFLKDLRKPPYQGKTFVVNNYAAPVAAMTGAWAYYDPLLTDGWTLSSRGYELPHDPRYVWFADRGRNKAYKKPDYYVCMTAQNLTTTVAKLTNYQHPTRKFQGCSLQGIVLNVVQDQVPFVNYQLTGTGGENSGDWAILKMDYAYLPYLEQLGPEKLAGVNLSFTTGPHKILLAAADYRFLHLDGEPEQGTTLELYAAANPACDEKDPGWKSIFRGPARQPVALPSGFSGKLQAFVIPRTGHTTGRQYFSQVLRVESGVDPAAIRACTADDAPAPPAALRALRVNPTTIQLSWRASPGDQRYRIEMARDSGAMQHIGDRSGDSLTYTVGDVASNAKFSFRIAACNAKTGACSWATPAVREEEATTALPANENQTSKPDERRAGLVGAGRRRQVPQAGSR